VGFAARDVDRARLTVVEPDQQLPDPIEVVENDLMLDSNVRVTDLVILHLEIPQDGSGIDAAINLEHCQADPLQVT
jgi:hypothetical protein